MKLKSIILISSVLLSVNTYVSAQADFYLNGYGRAIVSNNELTGTPVVNNPKTPNKGVSGYALWDLTPTVKFGDNLKVVSTLRVKNVFGGFWGNGNSFLFRQFQFQGKIANLVEYEVGDINVGEGMSLYAVNNNDNIYSKFESDIFTQRRQILEYENFNFGNKWRLQGAQARTKLVLGLPVIDTLGIYGFLVRTNATNDATEADRIMGGSRISFLNSMGIAINGNYVGLYDIPVNTALLTYKNQVFIADLGYKLNAGNLALGLKFNSGLSTYDFSNAGDSTMKVNYNDYFLDGGFDATWKPLKLKLFASYRNVGPQFYNPAAQTQRINPGNSATLFTSIGSNPRTMTLFDRYSNESQYNRALATTLQSFLPYYNNSTPYGVATPNRTGITIGLMTDTSAKIINTEVQFDKLSEIIGEGTTELRDYTVLSGGVSFELGKFIGSTRKYTLNAGYRNETTDRKGDAAINLKNNLLDAGFSFEVLKNVDVMLGYKMLTSEGKEILAGRNPMNLIVNNYTSVKYDLSQNIFSAGVNVRFNKTSFLNVTYNRANNTTGVDANDYKMNQLFVNLTVKL